MPGSNTDVCGWLTLYCMCTFFYLCQSAPIACAVSRFVSLYLGTCVSSLLRRLAFLVPISDVSLIWWSSWFTITHEDISQYQTEQGSHCCAFATNLGTCLQLLPRIWYSLADLFKWFLIICVSYLRIGIILVVKFSTLGSLLLVHDCIHLSALPSNQSLVHPPGRILAFWSHLPSPHKRRAGKICPDSDTQQILPDLLLCDVGRLCRVWYWELLALNNC